MLKKKIIAIFIIFFFFLGTGVLWAEENPDEKARNEIENKIQEYQKKLSELSQQRNTLSSQIQYMDTQISLTSYKIQETEQKVITTQKEIDILTSRIGGLDDSLNQLTKLLLKRIVEGYKKRSFSFFNLLLDSESANDFISRAKYLKTAQENNQKILVQVQVFQHIA